MSGETEPLTAEEEAKFRESVRMLGPVDDYGLAGSLHWSNRVAARLLATLDAERASRPSAGEAALREAAEALLAELEPVPLTYGMRRVPKVGYDSAPIAALRAALATPVPADDRP